MKQALVFLFVLLTAPVLHAQIAPPPNAVPEAQQRVWTIIAQLDEANFNLDNMKIDWQKGKLTEAMTKAKAKGDEENRLKFESKIAELDNRKAIVAKKYDLNKQLLLAHQQNDQSRIDSLNFQVKELQ